MKKFKVVLIGIISTIGLLAGCHANTSQSYTYNVDTGDKVKVTLNTADGYNMNSGNPFTVTKDDEDILTCQFLSEEGYSFYDSELKTDILESQYDGYIIETNKKGENEYIFYSVKNEHTENNFFVKLNDKTSIIIGSLSDEDVARKCFEKISFEIIE
jgi:thiol:disulfide interchange protein